MDGMGFGISVREYGRRLCLGLVGDRGGTTSLFLVGLLGWFLSLLGYFGCRSSFVFLKLLSPTNSYNTFASSRGVLPLSLPLPLALIIPCHPSPCFACH